MANNHHIRSFQSFFLETILMYKFFSLVLCFFFVSSVGAQSWIKNPSNGSLYTLTSSAMTWKQAEAEAVSWGGHLATIRNQSENDWVGINFNQGSNSIGEWIGLTDEVVEGTWVWSSGEPVTYLNWASGEPNNNGNEDYVHISRWTNKNAQWNDQNNGSGLMYGLVERIVPSKQYGTGCTGSNGKIPLLTTSPPKIGSSVDINLTNARALSMGIFFFGPSKANISLDFVGAPGCSLLVNSSNSLIGLTDSSGGLTKSHPVPNSLSLVGSHVYVQVFVIDLWVNSLGGVLTNGIDMTIG